MIKKTDVWVWAYNLENSPLDTETAGKWLLYENLRKIKRVFPKIDTLVNEGIIFRAKYTHREDPVSDPLPLSPPVLCVYADDNTKERVAGELRKLKLNPEEWKYESETAADWEEKGELRRQSEMERLLWLYEHSKGW